MADVDEPKFNSLADRIAALNQQKNFTSPPPSTAGKRPPPPPPPTKSQAAVNINGNAVAPPPTLPGRPQNRDTTSSPAPTPAPSLPSRTNTASSLNSATNGAPPSLPNRGAAPPLPGRKASTPAPPPRLPSRSSTMTPSAEPSPAQRVKAPSFDQSKLPPLPPSRKEREAQAAAQEAEAARAQAEANAAQPSIPTGRSTPNVPQVRPPPRLPSRSSQQSEPSQDGVNPQSNGARRLPPAPSTFVRPTNTQGSIPKTPARSSPPPIPTGSRPTIAQIEAVHSRAAANQAASCLICRDFSRPDNVAAQYPSHSLPRDDPVGYLANVLCAQFPSATDKARAIFTWFHHNIAYDVEEFFNKCIQRRSPEETIWHGAAVCQGYAETYRAIAERAGLECVLVSGHGKGYGHSPLKQGEPVPPKNAGGHAWNAVCIDNGEWKLIDACWGAGALCEGKYRKGFSPHHFYESNERFGLSHFPKDEGYFLLPNGRIPTWEEYFVGLDRGVEPAQFYGSGTEEGLCKFTFEPKAKHLSVYSGETVRFQFSKVCEHWDPIRNGKGRPRLLLLKIKGQDGRKDDLVPFDSDGFWWWADVPARDLGAPGQKVHLYALKTFNNRDARGITRQEYQRTKAGGCYSESWDIFAEWELV